jgi:uncharacterized protein (DUF2267 family)
MTNRPTKIDAIESTIQSTMEWIHAMGVALGQQHPPLAFRCLRAGLHAIRDRLPQSEVAALGAQLPMLVRGAYYEGWSPNHPERRAKTIDDLAEHVRTELQGGMAAPPHDVVHATIKVLHDHVDRHEVAKIWALMPEPIREAWKLPEQVSRSHPRT